MISDSGRWGGKLTSRPLPLGDASIDRLADEERAALATVWLARAATERRVADAFEVIHDALAALKTEGEVLRIAKRAVDDEYRHAELSRVVASRFAGTELPPPALLALRVPEHPGASEELRHTLHIVGQCALNETTASLFLEACLAHATGELASAALRELLSDEIDHARIGWAHLASVRPEIRAAATPWLLPLTKKNLGIWRESPRAPASGDVMTAHGAPPADVIEDALVTAVKDLILPGFKQAGIDARAVEAWLAAGAAT
ncbi:MAG: hypothetical protein JWM74_2239 [Myxococcaceae bacterium]|nr:hypothetical protein [Myxococcaceae bacterium]